MIASRARFRFSRKLGKLAGYRLPSSAFSGAVLDALSTGIDFDHLDRTTQNQLFSFRSSFLSCSCKDNPFCGCPERKFAKEIMQMRETGLDHRQISGYLLDEFGIEIFPADVLGFLEDSVHVLEAVRDIAELDHEYEIAEKTSKQIALIEG